MVPGNVFNRTCRNVRLTEPADSVVIKTKLVKFSLFYKGIRLGVAVESVQISFRDSPDAEEAQNVVEPVSIIIF